MKKAIPTSKTNVLSTKVSADDYSFIASLTSEDVPRSMVLRNIIKKYRKEVEGKKK